ncbi:uncharacterized protein cubi_00550 [Cryptosporidium ubiquitum]|uniref:Uncharacterized protein n=1 Tax=Cryptosporidium ubiquitum TaxID=857276 RepID=A0A1J4MCP3_9CRYT|nr:uncharacterized protein cubi_00550 [Cryptosporidium ubiquitum]OII71743.1 hypothetical protein cubi_00550 [Cryptosporidium ubiquitum]
MEISNTWSNYNILLNTILENSRSLYLGFNDGILQLYSCEENIKQEIKLEMSRYLNTIPSIVYSFPFSFCLSNFDFRDIISNSYYNYLSVDKDTWIINSFSNFYDIIESIGNCMDKILSNALAQESDFLLEPIIDSKKQIWAIHQKMRNYSINNPNEEFAFGQNTLICNYSMILDLEGSPRITGVVINGSEYQAPIFTTETKSQDLDRTNLTYNGVDIKTEEVEEINHDHILLETQTNNSDQLYPNQLSSIGQEFEDRTFQRKLIELDYLNQLRTIIQERNHFFVNKTISRALNNSTSVLDNNDSSKSPFNRTIYIPTSSILSNIEVFSEGMKELERNLSNNLVGSIIFIQILSLIIILISMLFVVFIFIPLILVENEKGKEIFSNYGFLILERYKYFSRKYSNEISSSLTEFYLLFEQLFSIIHKMVEKPKKNYAINTKKINEAQNFDNTKNVELIFIYKQLIGIIKFKLFYLRKFSICSSYCLALINEYHKNLNIEDINENNTNMNSILEIVSKLIDGNSLMIEVRTKTNNEQINNIDFFKSILIYIIISNLVYLTNSILGENKRIKLISEKKSIILSIGSEEENRYLLNNQFILLNILNSIGENCSSNIDECFEEFVIENNWLNILIEQLNLEFSIRTNSKEILIEISSKNNTKKVILCPGEKNIKNEILENGLFVLILENNNSYQNYIIEEECSKMGINFIQTKFSNLNLISAVKMEFLIIFVNKMFIKLDEIIKKVSEMINDQSTLRELIIFWLENDEIVPDGLIFSDNLDESNQNLYYLLDNNPLSIEHVNNRKLTKTKINQYFLKKQLSHSNLQKLLSMFFPKKTKTDYQYLTMCSPLQNIINIIDNNIIFQLSTKNFFANDFIFKLNNLKYYEESYNYNESKYLFDKFTKINNNDIPIKDLRHSLSIYSMTRPFDWKKNIDQKSVKLSFINSESQNRESNYEILTTQLLIISEDELTRKIGNAIKDVLLLLSIDKIQERTDMLMNFWLFIKRSIFIKNEKLLQYYCPPLVFHCIFVLKILIKNSINLIENVAFDFNNILALIISFISIPFIKPGISSNTILFSSEIIPVYTNELPPLESQICNILESVLSLPKFSNLFDDFEVISFGIKKWIEDNAKDQKPIGATFKAFEPIINHIVCDSNALFVSILFNAILYSQPMFEKEYSVAWIKRWITQKYWEDKFEELINTSFNAKISVQVRKFPNGSDLFNNFTIPWLNAIYQFDQLYSRNSYEGSFFVESFSRIKSNFDAWNEEYKKNTWDI